MVPDCFSYTWMLCRRLHEHEIRKIENIDGTMSFLCAIFNKAFYQFLYSESLKDFEKMCYHAGTIYKKRQILGWEQMP